MKTANRTELHNAVVKACMDLIAWNGGFVFKVFGGSYQRSGLPDILASLQGRFVACEVKTGDAEQNTDQKQVMREILQSNGFYSLSHSVEEFQQDLLDAGFDLRGRLS